MRKLFVIIFVCLVSVAITWAAWPKEKLSHSGAHFEIVSDDCDKCSVENNILKCGICNGRFDSGTRIESGNGYTKYKYTCLNKKCKHEIEAKLVY